MDQRRLRLIALFYGGLLTLHSLVAQAKPIPLSFEEAVDLALNGNYELRALRMQTRSLREKARQALSPSNPALSISHNDLPALDPSMTPVSEQISISYTLGFPGKAFAQSAALRSQAESSREDAFGKEIDLMAAIFNNMYAQRANAELEKILTEEIAKATDLIKLQQTRYSLGQGLQADIMNAKVALSKLQQDELNNRNEKISLRNELLSLLGHPSENEYEPNVDGDRFIAYSAPGLEELADLMLRRRPSIHSAEKQLDASEHLVRYAELQPFPDFQFTASMNDYKVSSAAPIQGMSRDYSLGISVTIPLFFPINELTGIRAAIADQETAQAKLNMVRAAARSDLIAARSNFVSNQFSLDQLVRVVIPAARASYELTLSTYARGKSDYMRLADARSTFIQVEKDLNARHRQAAQAFFQLIQVVGCDFTKNGGAHACD